MKKLLASFVLFVVIGILLSSCSNTSELAFNKRHYRSGFFYNVAGKNHTFPNSQVASIPVKTTQQIPPIVKIENHVGANASIISTQKSDMSQNKTQENIPVIIISNSQKQMVNQTLASTEVPAIQNKQSFSEVSASQGGGGSGAGGAALSLLWIIIVVVLILWLIGILAGGFGLGGLINVLLIIALVLLILWLLRIW